MSDLISREALRNELLKISKYTHDLYGMGIFEGLDRATRRVNDAPAVDAVEVVRCEDCDVPHNKWTGCPMLNGLVTPPDFYCGFGERREEADGKTICGTGSL